MRDNYDSIVLKGQLNKMGTQFTHITSHMRLYPGRRRGMRGVEVSRREGSG